MISNLSFISLGALLQLCALPLASLLISFLSHALLLSFSPLTHSSFPKLTKLTGTRHSFQVLSLFSSSFDHQTSWKGHSHLQPVFPIALSCPKSLLSFHGSFSQKWHHTSHHQIQWSVLSSQPPCWHFLSLWDTAVLGWLAPSLVNTQSLSGCSSSALLWMHVLAKIPLLLYISSLEN